MIIKRFCTDNGEWDVWHNGTQWVAADNQGNICHEDYTIRDLTIDTWSDDNPENLLEEAKEQDAEIEDAIKKELGSIVDDIEEIGSSAARDWIVENRPMWILKGMSIESVEFKFKEDTHEH